MTLRETNLLSFLCRLLQQEVSQIHVWNCKESWGPKQMKTAGDTGCMIPRQCFFLGCLNRLSQQPYLHCIGWTTRTTQASNKEISRSNNVMHAVWTTHACSYQICEVGDLGKSLTDNKLERDRCKKKNKGQLEPLLWHPVIHCVSGESHAAYEQLKEKRTCRIKRAKNLPSRWGMISSVTSDSRRIWM